MARLSVKTSEREDHVLLELAGELDVRGATVLDPEVARVAGEPGPPSVVLDLRRLEFLDSSGLRSVIVADRVLRAAGRRLSIVRGADAVHRVFTVTRMDAHLPFVDAPPGDSGGAEA